MMRSWMGLISGIKVNSPDCLAGEPGPAYGGYFPGSPEAGAEVGGWNWFSGTFKPGCQELAASVLGDMDRVHLINLDYEPFVNLMARSYLVLTDSAEFRRGPGPG